MSAKMFNLVKPSGDSAMLSRNQAVKYLQVSLSEFRMMCILLHISPKLVKQQQLFLQKDIKFLNNHPLVPVIRELKILKRKCIHYYHKDNAIYENYMEQVNNLILRQMPKIIQQNYPKFYNIWYDLDDILSLLYCVKYLPCNEYIGSKEIQKTEELLDQFELLLKKLKIGITKSFISIKGVYIQFYLQDQPITYVVPLHASQVEDIDVDYKVMTTFHMYYQCVMEHFLFKMAKLNKFEFPLTETAAVPKTLESVAMDSAAEPSDADITLKDFDVNKALFHASKNASLFQSKTFVLHREIPRSLFKFIIECCGGKVLYAEAVIEETDVIEVCDKPLSLLKLVYENGRAVQPQYIIDCLNAGKLIAYDGYRAGELLPSHVSPFEDASGTLATAEMVDSAEQQIMREEEMDALNNSEEEETGFIVKESEELNNQISEESIALKKEVAKASMTQKDRRLLGHIIANKSKKETEAKKLAKKRVNLKKQNK
eukprot:NODE_344_length_10554_cov_0.516308.p3 type:complete len:485 gc:universal NODE_344_length_10554_cov_0.516308:7944-6490(-)